MLFYSMTRRSFLSIHKIAIPVILVISCILCISCSESPKELRTIDVNQFIADGKLDDAVKEITLALAEFPNNADLLYNLATIQHLQGKLSIAKQTLLKALSVSPNDDDANYLMVKILIDTGNIQEAWDRFHMLSKAYRETARTQHTLGYIHYSLGNWQNAENCFRAVIELGGNSPAAKAAMAFIACKQERFDTAKAYLLEAETSSGLTPEATSQIAECYLLLEQAQKARDIARTLTQQHPSDARYWSLLGRAEMKLLNFADAENAFTRAMTASNTTPWIQVQYAEMLFASHREDEALTQAMYADTRITNMKLPVLNPSLYNLLATLYARNGQLLLAQQYLNRSLQIDPSQTKITQILNAPSGEQDIPQQTDSQPESNPSEP